VSIPTTTAQLGTFIGASTSGTVAGFDITKDPITVARYRQCVGAGACSVPSDTRPRCQEPIANPKQTVVGATYSDDSANDDLPVTCATVKQAESYCTWLGAKLPTPQEWLVAVRGQSVTRYVPTTGALSGVLTAPTELTKSAETALPACSGSSYCQVGSVVQQGAIDTIWVTSDAPEVATRPLIYSATFGFRCAWEAT
jgi:hypothetical protein